MKMNKTIFMVIAALVLGWGVAATNDPVKIGVVDIEQVLANVDRGKAARDELERKGREAQQRLAPIVEKIQSMQKEAEAKQFVMSEEAKRAMQLDMVELQNEYETKAKQEEGQFKIDQQRLIGPLLEKLDTVIKEVGRDNNYSVILRVDAPSLVYTREALDITDLITKSFNKKG